MANPKKEYKWKSNARVPVDPEVAGRELERIREKTGRLEPEDVLKAAKAKRSPLHAAFEWDDSAAAVAYRLQQARYMIRMIEVTIIRKDEKPRTVRAYVRLAGEEDDAGGYESTVEVLSDQERREILLAQALDELRHWQTRYENLRELADVFIAIEKTRKRVAGKRRKSRSRVSARA